MLILMFNNSFTSLIIPPNISQRTSEFASGLSLEQCSLKLFERSVDAILIHV